MIVELFLDIRYKFNQLVCCGISTNLSRKCYIGKQIKKTFKHAFTIFVSILLKYKKRNNKNNTIEGVFPNRPATPVSAT